MEGFQEIFEPMFGGCWGPSTVDTVHTVVVGAGVLYSLEEDDHLLHPQEEREDLQGVCDCLLCDCVLYPTSCLCSQPFLSSPPHGCHILRPSLGSPRYPVHAGGATQEEAEVAALVPVYFYSNPVHVGHLCYDSV